MRRAALLALLLVACAPPPAPAKPVAPVAVSLSAAPAGLGARLTVAVRPTTAARAVVVEVRAAGERRPLRRVTLRDLAAGERREVIVDVAAAVALRPLVALARVDDGRAAAAALDLGPRRAPPPERILVLPDGRRVAEVGP
jgi:hypothetical protein